jgi:hypothetical protein
MIHDMLIPRVRTLSLWWYHLRYLILLDFALFLETHVIF